MSEKSGPDSAVFVWLVFLVLFADKSGRSCLCGCFVHYSGPSGLLGEHLARWQVAGAPAAGVLQATGDNSIHADLGNPQTFCLIIGDYPLGETMPCTVLTPPRSTACKQTYSGAVSPAPDGDCACVPSGQPATASALCDTITRDFT
jgi:hypothetical protein